MSRDDNEETEAPTPLSKEGAAGSGLNSGVKEDAVSPETPPVAVEPVVTVADQVADAQTPMMLVLGMAGGAGAAAWNAELPGGAAQVEGGKTLPESSAAEPGPEAKEPAAPEVPEAAPVVQEPERIKESPVTAPIASQPPPDGLPTLEKLESKPVGPATSEGVAPETVPVAAAGVVGVNPPDEAAQVPSSSGEAGALAAASEAGLVVAIESEASGSDEKNSSGVASEAAEPSLAAVGPLKENPESEPTPDPVLISAAPPAAPPMEKQSPKVEASGDGHGPLPAESPISAPGDATVSVKSADATASTPDPAPADPPVAAGLSDLAALAGLAESLPSLPVPSGRTQAAKPLGAPAPEAAARPLPPAKPRATVTSLSEKPLPDLPSGDARVVATALLPAAGDPLAEEAVEEPPGRPQDPPFSASDGDPMAELPEEPESRPTPSRLAPPPAHDELAPKRADRSSAAFGVPAAAGDLLIAANSQTDFQMDDRRVVFTGSVVMKNERFYLTADRLVAYMKEDQSGLEFAEAQGNVIVRMVQNGQETGSSGLSKTAVFHPETGEIVLKGWPQLRMGNKAHVASSATTEMSLFTDGRMKTSGRNQTMIVP